MSQIFQANIYLADLSPAKGHEQSGLRPVIVLQNDILNRCLTTVVVAPLTANLKLKGLMTTFFVKINESGLNKDSVVLLHQIRTVDKTRLIKLVGSINKDTFMELRIKLTRVFW